MRFKLDEKAMKITSVAANNRRHSFQVSMKGSRSWMPYSKCDPRPTVVDPVTQVFVDTELANEAFTHRLRSGKEGSVHVEQVLEYNKSPTFLRDALLYEITLNARKRIAESPLSKREIIRRMGTSAAQLYRLLDQTNNRKSVDQMLRLLAVLDCDVHLVVSEHRAA